MVFVLQSSPNHTPIKYRCPIYKSTWIPPMSLSPEKKNVLSNNLTYINIWMYLFYNPSTTLHSSPPQGNKPQHTQSNSHTHVHIKPARKPYLTFFTHPSLQFCCFEINETFTPRKTRAMRSYTEPFTKIVWGTLRVDNIVNYDKLGLT